MSATETEPRVDIGALAGKMWNETADRIAQLVVQTINWLDNAGLSLNEMQKTELVKSALLASEGLLTSLAESLKTMIEADGVATWGLGRDLERFLSNASRDAAAAQALRRAALRGGEERVSNPHANDGLPDD